MKFIQKRGNKEKEKMKLKYFLREEEKIKTSIEQKLEKESQKLLIKALKLRKCQQLQWENLIRRLVKKSRKLPIVKKY